MSLNEARLCEVIKVELRKKRFTVSEFAAELEVPLPTVKRWLKGKGVALSAWAKMLNVLGLSLADVATIVSDPATQQFEYMIFPRKNGLEKVNLRALNFRILPDSNIQVPSADADGCTTFLSIRKSPA